MFEKVMLITGPRDETDEIYIKSCFDDIYYKYNPDLVLVGGAQGVDKIIELYCKSKGIPVAVWTANWNLYSKGAGPIRNCQMISKSELCSAIGHKGSKGTSHCINEARKKGIMKEVFEKLS